MKTLVGAWHTSRRMHEDPIRSCLLECGGEDSLEHYTGCKIWRKLFNECPALAMKPSESVFHFGSVPGIIRGARGYQTYCLLKVRTRMPSEAHARVFGCP